MEFFWKINQLLLHVNLRSYPIFSNKRSREKLSLTCRPTRYPSSIRKPHSASFPYRLETNSAPPIDILLVYYIVSVLKFLFLEYYVSKRKINRKYLLTKWFNVVRLIQIGRFHLLVTVFSELLKNFRLISNLNSNLFNCNEKTVKSVLVFYRMLKWNSFL